MTQRLTQLQLAILDVLWRQGEAGVVAVHEALREERAIAQSTVATLLARLEDRGLVKRRPDGRQFLYSANVTREAAGGSLVEEFTALAKRLYAGDPAGLMSALLDAADIEAEDLALARQLLAEREREKREGEG